MSTVIRFQTDDAFRVHAYTLAARANVHAPFVILLKGNQVAVATGFVEGVRAVTKASGGPAWIVTIREEELSCPTTQET